jgi:hypothetical protein
MHDIDPTWDIIPVLCLVWLLTRPLFTTTRLGLMPCIPIGLFDFHVLPPLCLSFSPPFPFLVLYFIFLNLSHTRKIYLMRLYNH